MKEIHFRYLLPQEKKRKYWFLFSFQTPPPPRPHFQPSLLSLCLSLSPSPSLPRPHFHQTDRQAFFTPANPALLIDLHWPTYASGDRRRADARMHRCTFTIMRALGCTKDITFSFFLYFFFFTCCCFCLQHSCIPSDPAAHVKGSPGRFPLWGFSITPANTSAHRLTAPLLLSSRLLFHAHTQYVRVCVHTHACVHLRDCGMFFKHCVCVCVSMRLRAGQSFATDVCDLFR